MGVTFEDVSEDLVTVAPALRRAAVQLPRNVTDALWTEVKRANGADDRNPVVCRVDWGGARACLVDTIAEAFCRAHSTS